MKKILQLTIICGCLSAHAAFGISGTLSGYLYNKETREPVPDANVVIEGTKFGTVSKDGGFFAIAGIPEGEYRLRVRVLGYQEEARTVQVAGNLALRLEWTPTTIDLEPVVVTATLSDHRLSQVSVAS